MKAEINKDGYISITAETATEAFALKHLIGNVPCGECGNYDVPTVIDTTVLNNP